MMSWISIYGFKHAEHNVPESCMRFIHCGHGGVNSYVAQIGKYNNRIDYAALAKYFALITRVIYQHLPATGQFIRTPIY